jgi:molecular chaperone DnaJ
VSKRDYYEILEVTRTATDTEIKSSYRRLAMKFHPDRNPGDQLAEEKFKEAAEAYAVLADEKKRGLYDRFGHAGVGTAAGGSAGFDPSVFAEFGDFADILGNMFGFGDLFGGGGGGRGGAVPSADPICATTSRSASRKSARGAETTVQISAPGKLRDVPRHRIGARIVVEHLLPVQGPGPGPLSTGLLHGGAHLPAMPAPARSSPSRARPATARTRHARAEDHRQDSRGIATGQQLRLQHEGEAGAGGGPAGHLYVVITSTSTSSSGATATTSSARSR